jgi:hypothetical protein
MLVLKGRLEHGLARRAAILFETQVLPYRLMLHNLVAERDRVDAVVPGPETPGRREKTMKAKQYTIAILAVLMMAGISVTGCSSIKQGGAGETEVAQLGSGKAMQIWRCELDDEATEEQVLEHAQKWLAAARTLKGGKNLELYVKFPVVVNATNQIDLLLVLVAPSFKEWGQFWDAYGNSDAGDHELTAQEFLVCPDSTMWESFKVNPAGETHPVDKTAGAPFGESRAVQWWRCELIGDATEEQVLEHAQKWLAAARTVKGGEDLNLYVNFPVVVNATGKFDLLLMLVAPNFEKWGEFWDGYGDSAAGDLEEASEKILVAPDSVMWEAFRVKTP